MKESIVNIWICKTDSREIQDIVNQYHSLLSTSEAVNLSKIMHEKDRINTTIGRLIIRDIVSCYTHHKAGDVNIGHTLYGRPFIINNPFGIKFNISHTDNIVVCATSIRSEVGIDVEKYINSNNYMAVARRYFSMLEYSDILTLPECQRKIRFTEYWTLKEAFGKACGVGLQLPLNSTEFKIDPNTKNITVEYNHECRENHDRWVFYQYTINDNYIMSIATENGNKNTIKINMIKPFTNIEKILISKDNKIDLAPL